LARQGLEMNCSHYGRSVMENLTLILQVAVLIAQAIILMLQNM
jgi:hypothetical protein